MSYYILKKSHVKAYTRKDGATVAEHDNKVAAHPHPWNTHHKDVRRMATEHGSGNQDRETFESASDDMKNGDHAALKSKIKHADTYQAEQILSHIHPDHWPKLGSTPLNKEKAVKDFERSHGVKKSLAFSVAHIIIKRGK